MSCRKFKVRVEEAGIAPGVAAIDLDLAAHLKSCAACRAEFARLRELSSAIESGLKSLVAGKPSPAFAAGVRARIADEPDPRWTWLAGWWPAAVGALVLLALFAALPRFDPRDPRAPTGQTTAGATQPAQLPPSGTLQASPESSSVASVAPPAGRVPQGKNSAPLLDPGNLQGLSVLVERSQWANIFRFYQAAQKGNVTVVNELTATSEAGPEKIMSLEIAELKIAPLEVPQLREEEKPAEAPKPGPTGSGVKRE